MVESNDNKLKSYNVNIIINDTEHDFIMWGYSEEEVSRALLDKIYLTHPTLVSKINENDINIREL